MKAKQREQWVKKEGRREWGYYLFDELPEDTQQAVIDKTEWRYVNVEDGTDWSEGCVEDFKADLAAEGFLDAEVFFSGFSCQGDGASFKAGLDLNLFIEKHVDDLIRGGIDIFWLRAVTHQANAWGRITQSGRYCHANTMGLELEISFDTDAADFDDTDLMRYDTALREFILDDAREAANGFFKTLWDEYDCQTSDEAVKDTLRAGEYRFNRRGELLHETKSHVPLSLSQPS